MNWVPNISICVSLTSCFRFVFELALFVSRASGGSARWNSNKKTSLIIRHWRFDYVLESRNTWGISVIYPIASRSRLNALNVAANTNPKFKERGVGVSRLHTLHRKQSATSFTETTGRDATTRRVGVGGRIPRVNPPMQLLTRRRQLTAGPVMRRGSKRNKRVPSYGQGGS